MNVGAPNRYCKAGSMLRESDMPIVVMTPEKVKAGGGKGHYYENVPERREGRQQ